MYTYLVCDNCDPVSLPLGVFDSLSEVAFFTSHSKFWLSRALSSDGVAILRGFTVYRFLSKILDEPDEPDEDEPDEDDELFDYYYCACTFW